MFFGTLLPAQLNPNYEFRAVWVASVDNIDWPTSKNLSVDAQKAAFIKLLDMHQQNGMNAVVVQIRPAGDALYPSQLEPWSEFLTGKQGKPPIPYYDPLEFMIQETHHRGLEFHAWLNPYRAVFNMKTSSVAPTHLTRLHPEWFLVYGDKKYFNPALPEVKLHTARVVKDIVARYDLDAIHMDDYFYPYRIAGKEFPDKESYQLYGNGMNKENWRRSNVDSIIKLLYLTIRSTNPRVKFGISPFGIWRNKSQDPMGSDTKGGQTNYDDLYADILLWLRNGWIDYVAPQLYWEIGHKVVDYNILLNWWASHTYGRQLFIGHGIYRGVGKETKGWSNPNEIPNQIKLLRRYPNVQGSIYFSSKSFEKNPLGWNDSLQNNYYKYPALLPPMRWIDNEKPWPPIVERIITDDSIIQLTVNPDPRNRVEIKYYVVYQYAADSHTETFGNVPRYISRFVSKPGGFQLKEALSSQHFSYRYVITAVGKNNNESDLSEIAILVQPGGKWSFYNPRP